MSSLQLERPETKGKTELAAPPLPYRGRQLQPSMMPMYHTVQAAPASAAPQRTTIAVGYERPSQPQTEMQAQAPTVPTYTQLGYKIPYANPTAAFLLELLGYAGFLGIGHIYAGNVIGGLLMLLFGWSLAGLAYVLLSILSLGIGFIVFLPVLLAVPIISGVWAYRIAEKNERLRSFA